MYFCIEIPISVLGLQKYAYISILFFLDDFLNFSYLCKDLFFKNLIVL